jgi:hypothetical protein
LKLPSIPVAVRPQNSEADTASLPKSLLNLYNVFFKPLKTAQKLKHNMTTAAFDLFTLFCFSLSIVSIVLFLGY